MTTPRRFTILHLSQMRLTLARTFMGPYQVGNCLIYLDVNHLKRGPDAANALGRAAFSVVVG